MVGAQVAAPSSHERVDVSAALDKAWKDIDWDSRRERMRTTAIELNKTLKHSLGLAKRCLSLVEKARRSPNALRKLHTVEKELVQAIQPIIFISQVQQQSIREIMTQSQEARDLQEMLDLSKKLYRLILDAEHYAHAPLVKALKALTA